MVLSTELAGMIATACAILPLLTVATVRACRNQRHLLVRRRTGVRYCALLADLLMLRHPLLIEVEFRARLFDL